MDLEFLFYFSFFFHLVLFYLKEADKGRYDVHVTVTQVTKVG